MATSHSPKRRTGGSVSGPPNGVIWRERAVGALLTVLAVLLALGLFSHLVPNENQFLGTLSRIADSMRPWLLILAILLSLALLPLRAWRSAAITCLVALTGLGSIAWDYRSRSVPWAEQADLRVLWFNVLYENEIAPDRLETELRNSGADIIVMTEAMPAYEMKDRLADLYPHVIGCRSQTSCPMMILSRLEPEAVEEERPTGPTRSLFGFTVTPEGHPPMDIVAAHLVKPWYLSVAAGEASYAARILKRGPRQRPLLVVGDFNAAPWSRRVRSFEETHGLRHPPRPVGTWPASLGNLGVPIDHMLVRRGVRFAWQEAWGGHLGSNHRGLLAGIALPDPEDG